MKTIRVALLCLGLMHIVFAHATNWLTTQLSYQPENWDTGQVIGLNNLGQVIGIIAPPGPPPGTGVYDTIAMPFVTGPNGSNLQPIDPGYVPYPEHCIGCHPESTPQAINDAGQIAISSYTPWTGELSVALAGLGGGAIPQPPSATSAFAVHLNLNNSGQLAGTYYGPPVSFVTGANGNNPQMLNMLDNSQDSHVSGVNDSGQLLVSGVLTGSTENTTFVTGANASGVAFEVGTFGQNSFANGLNNSAQLFGSYQMTAGGEQRAFITGANGVGFADIGSLGGPTFANALNDKGMIVGESGGQAFLYGLNGTGMLNLNTLVSLGTGEYLNSAQDINDLGQIVAESNLGKMYLLSPVPEPATYMMFLGGLAFIYWRARLTFHVKRS